MSQKKILIIEDHQATRQMLEMSLQAAGYEVHSVGDGIKLLKMIREIQPDLLVMDIMMPWVDGFELTSTIRDTADMADIPIVVVSAKASPEDIQKAKQLGANEFLPKPVDIQRLTNTVSALIS